MQLVGMLRSVLRGLVRRPGVRRKPGSHRGRARAAVVLGGAAAVAAQVGLSVAVETTRPEWRDPEFFHRLRNLSLMARWCDRYAPGTPVVVVLGSSRPAMGFSPEHVREGCGADPPLVYNCAQTGCQAGKQRVNLGRVFDAGLRVDFVLIEVFTPTLGHPGAVEDQIPARRMGYRDLRRVGPYLTNPEAVWAKWAWSRVAPWYSLRVDLLAHAGLAEWTPKHVREEWLWNASRVDGWGPYYPAGWSDEEHARHFARAVAWMPGATVGDAVNPVVDRAYRDMLAECRDRGVRAGLYLMPESPAFRALYPPAAVARNRGLIDSLAAEFGVPVFDASGWVESEAAFMDGHHLLGPGAVRFSERFGRECVRPWVGGR